MNDVHALIPHSGAMVLLDSVIDYDQHRLSASLIVSGDGLLAGDEYSVPAWLGIEYMAQTIGAYAGVLAKQANEPIRLGFLLGTRRYCSNVPVFKVGAVLTVQVARIFQDDDLSVFDCRIFGDGVEVSANLNVYQPPLS
ncbi:MAG: hotdog family protein [Methylococcales bacterium]